MSSGRRPSFKKTIDDEVHELESRLERLEQEVTETRMELIDAKMRQLAAADDQAKGPEAATAAPGGVALSEELFYTGTVQSWEDGAPLPPKMLLTLSEAVVLRLGPATFEKSLAIERLAGAQNALRKMAKGGDISQETRVQANIATLEKGVKNREGEVSEALRNLEDIGNDIAGLIAPRLMDDESSYESEIRAMCDAEPGVLEEINDLARAMNRGPLEVGTECQALIDGKFHRAKILRTSVGAADTHEVSLWNIMSTVNNRYQEGFATTKPIKVMVERSHIYKMPKPKQALSTAAVAAAKKRLSLGVPLDKPDELTRLISANLHWKSGGHNSMDFAGLILLLRDAERTLPHLRALGKEIDKLVSGCHAKLGPLKTMTRSLAKTFEKYHGDFTWLTDLARMTFECASLKAAKEVFKLLMSHAGFELKLVKNRIALEFDASESGGYRDMLLNLVCKKTNHVVEVQITLENMMKVKTSGGHSAYKLARTFGFFKPEVYKHYGALSKETIKKVSSGVLRALECRGWSGLESHADDLREALESPSCMVRDLKLVKCDYPHGRSLDSFLTPKACERMAPHLEGIRLWTMPYTGAMPRSIAKFKKCKEIWFQSSCPVPGGMPSWLGELSSLETMQLWGNQFTGSIPSSISNCKNLQVLSLLRNKLTGPIPPELTELENLVEISLQENDLSGELPRNIGRWKKMEKLTIYSNPKLCGTIPDSIGLMQSLKELRLQSQSLTGPVPESLANCRKLTLVSVANNGLTGPSPEQMLSFCPGRYLGNNQFS